tara:strand:+ start:1003 stop:1347 length:345 start_codon:yes stop_codon:yes gene_type:complete
MVFKSLIESSNTTLLLSIVLFFVFVMPMLEKSSSKNKEDFSNNIKQYLIPVKSKIDALKCSHSCCNWNQWPVPHMKINNSLSTNLTCNRGNGSGCVCAKKEDIDFLGKRGGNSF